MPEGQVKVTLTVIKGPDRERSCEIDGKEVRIGRGSPVLPLTDPNISQEHFKVLIRGSEVWIEDLCSRNGTFLKDQKIVEKKKVENLDEIHLGKTVLRIFILDDLGTLKKVKPSGKTDEETSSRSIKDLIQDELKEFSKWDLGDDVESDLEGDDIHMEPYLLRILNHEGDEYQVRVRKSLVMIGRTKTDIEIPDPDISRLHATLEYEGPKRIKLRDMGSTNGTLVNGKKTKEVQLKDGDRIQMGSTVLEIIFSEK